MVSKLRLLLVVIFSVGEVMGSIMEYPEYVTVTKGDPAALICRVDIGALWLNLAFFGLKVKFLSTIVM